MSSLKKSLQGAVQLANHMIEVWEERQRIGSYQVAVWEQLINVKEFIGQKSSICVRLSLHPSRYSIVQGGRGRSLELEIQPTGWPSSLDGRGRPADLRDLNEIFSIGDLNCTIHST